MKAMICRDERRREAVRREQHLNGLDYLEVGADRRTLAVYFLGKAPVSLQPSNVLIEGGRKIRDVRVERVTVTRNDMAEFDDFMEVVTDREGDFSTYTLRVVDGRDEAGNWQRHPGFDPRYDRVEFSFKVDCPSDLDCRQDVVCPPERPEQPEIDYLAKDYASFRQLILDRLALVMPEWRERHVPDLAITLVELLAYVGDHLSYYQDAVATEAYLGTARQRISVRRHARLVDYALHEGCNARTWVCVETEGDLPPLQAGDIYFVTRTDGIGPVVTDAELQSLAPGSHEVFEPMAEDLIRLYAAQHEIRFYAWGDAECCLPRGTTTATLAGRWIEPSPNEPSPCNSAEEILGVTTPEPAGTQNLHLARGDVLIFEEVVGPKTGNPADADRRHRQAVRLTDVRHGRDPLHPEIALTEIAWDVDDALAFPLCLSAIGPPPDCKPIDAISVARGNLVLVDHGATVYEPLGPVPLKENSETCDCHGTLADSVAIPDRFQPILERAPLSFRQPVRAATPATRMLKQDVRETLPQVKLTGTAPPSGESAEWVARSDLLASGGGDLHFVVEVDNRGRSQLRFGDGKLGQRPQAGTTFDASYRVGNGPSGNVGAETIRHLVTRAASLSGGITGLRNPLPASGGTAPEPLAEAKLCAPGAFRTRLERAITPEDYAAIVLREFPDRVQRAAAQLRWNGSWNEMLVAVDPLGRDEADAGLLQQIGRTLRRYRRIGHDLVVRSAHRVALDIELLICVLPGYLRGHVKAALLDVFSNRGLADGGRGYFHPDNLTFGEGIRLSKLVAAAQGVQGVASVTCVRLQRLYESPDGEIENGLLQLGPLEIARLDSDPGFPEHGRLTLDMRGGR